jgi:hypothetical protein
VRRLVLVLPTLLAAIAIGACGGGSGAEVEEVTATIEESVFSRDPATCRELYTPALLEQSYDRQGEQALRACEEETVSPSSPQPDRITVSRVEIDGDDATAGVSLVGSVLDGQTVSFALIRDADVWKLDRLLGFVGFDREKALFGLGREWLRQAETRAHAEAAACALRQIEGLSTQGLEQFFIESDQEEFEDLVRICTPRSASA